LGKTQSPIGKNRCLLFWKNPTGVLWFGEKTFAFLFLEKPTRGKKPSCYLVVVAIVGKTQCFVLGKNLFSLHRGCRLSVYRLHRVAAYLVFVSIGCISLIVGVVAISLLLIGVVVVVDVTIFAFAASTTVHY